MDKNIDEYIQQGIHCIRETKPDERRKFLGTLRERVVVVLTKQQVRERGTYKEVEELIKKNNQAILYLNGKMDYSYLSDYIKVANEVGTKYRISTNHEYDSDLGLVLAYDYAIDNEDIYIENPEQHEKDNQDETENRLAKFFKNLFHHE